jgi:predicted DNA-binding protein
MKKDKKKKEKREVEVKVRLTAEEKEEIKRLAKEEGLTISQYIRKQALKKQVETGEIKEFKYEVRKIGVNINQMAWALNVLKTREKIGDKVFLEIKARIEKSLNQLEEVTKKCLST